MIPQMWTPAQRLYSYQFHRICQERCEHADGVGAAPNAGHHLVRQVPCLFQELLPCLLADNILEISHHQWEGMGTCRSADAVDGVLVFLGIGDKSSVHRLLQCPEPEFYRDHVGAQHLHTGHVRGLFGDVHLSHVDVTLQTEVSGCGGQSHTVLPRSGLRDKFLLAHELGKQTLAHTVV